MSKFFFKRKRKEEEEIEPAESGEVSEAELLKDVQAMKRESKLSEQKLEAELEKIEEEIEMPKPDTIDWVDVAIDDFVVPKDVKPIESPKNMIIKIEPTKKVESEKVPAINIDADNLKKELNKLKDKESEYPDVANKISMKEMWIDATPDDQYALRILKAYRKRCDEKWQVEGFPKERRLLYDAMNAHQEQRAKELDRAIALLERGRR